MGREYLGRASGSTLADFIGDLRRRMDKVEQIQTQRVLPEGVYAKLNESTGKLEFFKTDHTKLEVN